jgi:hypothetical protein
MDISFVDLDELHNKRTWYSQLRILELNHVYKLWDDEETPVNLHEGLKEYLKK